MNLMEGTPKVRLQVAKLCESSSEFLKIYIYHYGINLLLSTVLASVKHD